jgi:hypothetical protein
MFVFRLVDSFYDNDINIPSLTGRASNYLRLSTNIWSLRDHDSLIESMMPGSL